MEQMVDGEVVIALHPDPRHHHGAGRVHGGIISLLMDNAGFFAAATRSRGNWVVTAELKVNLLDSFAGEIVRATGRVLRAGRHVIHAEMRAETERKVIAAGLGTYTVLPRAFRRPANPVEAKTP